MKLVIVRHADAGDAEEFAKTGQPDAFRPLTDKGREQTQSIAEGLRKLVPSCDLIATSPYTRAMQTAEIIIAAYGHRGAETTSALEPAAAPADFEEWLRGSDGNAAVVMIVGHEPNLSTLATYLMAGVPGSRIDLKKAGACQLAFEGEAQKGRGVLQWLMGPKQLAAVAAGG